MSSLAPYMEWAKHHPRSRVSLAGSNLLPCELTDLPGAREALELARRQRQRLRAAGRGDRGALRRVAATMVVTAQGTSGANFLVFAALVKAGRRGAGRAAGLRPADGPAALLGANVTRFDRRFEDGYRLDPDAVRAAMTPRTRLIVVTNAHNPTGVVAARCRPRRGRAGSPSGTARSSWWTRCISTPRSPGPSARPRRTSPGVHLHEQPHQELRPRRPALRLGDRASRRRRVGARARATSWTAPARSRPSGCRCSRSRCSIGSRPARRRLLEAERRARCARSWNRSPQLEYVWPSAGTVGLPAHPRRGRRGPVRGSAGARVRDRTSCPGASSRRPPTSASASAGGRKCWPKACAQLGRALAHAPERLTSRSSSIRDRFMRVSASWPNHLLLLSVQSTMAFVRLASAGLLSAVLAGVLLVPLRRRAGPGCRAREGRRARGAAVFGDARRLDGEGRRRAGRRGVGARAGHADRVRVDARRQRPAARAHRLPRDLRREEPLPGVPRLRPAAVRDPRAPDGPRRDRHVRPGRPRHDHDRHVQRRAARLPVPGERAGRAGRRGQQRDGRRRGLVLGRDLELGRTR